MPYDYLDDTEFLVALHKTSIQNKYIKLTILSFNEEPIVELQSKVFTGTLNINGNSTVRRTINLSMLINEKIVGIESLISLDKKIKVEIGYDNTLFNYKKYGDQIWFPCGVFLITSGTATVSASGGYQIQITAQDKMVMLNGTAGGTLQAMTTFDTKYETDENDNIISKKVKIYDIIYETLNHLGGELSGNILINDLDNRSKKLIKYIGSTPLRFNTDFSAFIISNTPSDDYPNIFYEGDDVGYMEQELIYPGELVLNAGSTITNLLDKLVEFLGNYEYFYDIYGNFIFQEIKNYKYNSYSIFTNLNNQDYIKYFSDSRYLYDLNDFSTINSFSVTPQYQNIKNDFLVWGSLPNSETKIRYHLVIDNKPQINLAKKYMWFNKDANKYAFTDNENNDDPKYELIGKPCSEWREELYRNALYTFSETGQRASAYDTELLVEWRKLFDTLKDTEEVPWKDGWNPLIKSSPSSITYWLDFIDTPNELGKYSISKIGRRTKVLSDDKIFSLFNPIVPDVIFIENPGDPDQISQIIQKYAALGQKFCFYTTNIKDYFSISSTGACAYDKIREMLYQYLIYNLQITLTTIPRYYLEPNNLIYLRDDTTGVDGDFVISSLSIPLSYSGFMNITLIESIKSI